MSSSSSDSDSDDFEPIRKIKINIRPKEEVANRRAADVSEIRASVEAWRPLGPPPHPSLSRRQSSLSSVSSISLNPHPTQSGFSGSHLTQSTQIQPNGQATIYSSPSCSSLVNEFNNRSSFSNFTISRTSSPLAFVTHGDAVPIAIAIQESIDVVIRGRYDPDAIEPKYHSRSLGNIKVAFSNAFVRGSYGKPSAVLKLRIHSTENITRYFASRLIRDLDTNSNSILESTASNNNNNLFTQSNELYNKNPASNGDSDPLNSNSVLDHFDSGTSSPGTPTNSKLIEFDMDALENHLKSLHDQSPNSRYYNVDVLRYQISPLTSIEKCPLQVCAYWKIEPEFLKLRIDFKHSCKSGLKLERLRDVAFTIDLSPILSENVDIESIYPPPAPSKLEKLKQDPLHDLIQPLRPRSLLDDVGLDHNRSAGLTGHDILLESQIGQSNISDETSESVAINTSNENRYPLPSSSPPNPTGASVAYMTFEPKAQWNGKTKQLLWKFDNLLQFYKNDGISSLLAKVDSRNSNPNVRLTSGLSKPNPVDVKFTVIDSTISRMNPIIDSIGYKISMLKREVRSGTYKSEPYIM